MNAPFLRTLWKEYRSLRVLWIGVTLGTLALFALIMLLMNGDAYGRLHYFTLVWVLSIWLPAIYLMACTSAQFAGEHEERTASWLIHLGGPFRPTISAKLLWVAVSTLLMQAILMGVATQLGWFIQDLGGPHLNEERNLGTTRFATFLIVESLAFGIFWSLQTQSVMRALLLSAITVVLINLFTSLFWTPRGETWVGFYADALGPWGILRTGLTLAVFIIDYFLAQRWLAGQSIEWPIPWDRRWSRSAAVPRAVPAAMALELSTGWTRAWQRFRWLEWQTIRSYLWLYFGLCAFLIAWFSFSLLCFSQPGGHSALVFPWFAAVLCPLVTGLMSWQGEQRREQFRFLVNRGVSPIGLWWNKFGLWFAVCSLSVVLLVVLAIGFSAAALVWWTERSSIPFHVRLHQQWRAFFIELPYFLWAGVAMFLGALTVGLYFRRTIYAVAVGALLTVILAILVPISISNGLPAWLGIVPVAVWLFWCSLRQLPRWYLERSGWKTYAVISAEWLVFPMVFAVVVTAYWVYAVPSPDVEQMLQEPYQKAQLPPAAELDAPWRAASLAIENLCREHSELLTIRDTDRPDDIRRQFTTDEWKTLEPGVQAIRDLLLTPIGMTRTTHFHELSEKHHIFGNRVVLHILMQGANRALLAGQTEESLRYVRAAVRFGGALWVAAPMDSTHATRRKQLHADLHGRLVDWAQLSPRNPEIVAAAIEQIQRGELRFWQLSDLALEADYRRTLDEIEDARHDLGWAYPPWIAERGRRHAACAYSNRATYLANLSPYLLLHMAFDVPFSHENLARQRAWTFRDVPQRLDPSGLPVGLDPAFLAWSMDQEIRLRCTLGTMAVVAFRGAHGRLPVSFDELSPEFGPADNWQLRRLMTELKLQADGKWPAIYPHNLGPNTESNAGLPFVYVKPFTGQWGDQYLFPVPPPANNEIP